MYCIHFIRSSVFLWLHPSIKWKYSRWFAHCFIHFCWIQSDIFGLFRIFETMAKIENSSAGEWCLAAQHEFGFDWTTGSSLTELCETKHNHNCLHYSYFITKILKPLLGLLLPVPSQSCSSRWKWIFVHEKCKRGKILWSSNAVNSRGLPEISCRSVWLNWKVAASKPLMPSNKTITLAYFSVLHVCQQQSDLRHFQTSSITVAALWQRQY